VYFSFYTQRRQLIDDKPEAYVHVAPLVISKLSPIAWMGLRAAALVLAEALVSE
jgi:hypothetical protein